MYTCTVATPLLLCDRGTVFCAMVYGREVSTWGVCEKSEQGTMGIHVDPRCLKISEYVVDIDRKVQLARLSLWSVGRPTSVLHRVLGDRRCFSGRCAPAVHPGAARAPILHGLVLTSSLTARRGTDSRAEQPMFLWWWTTLFLGTDRDKLCGRSTRAHRGKDEHDDARLHDLSPLVGSDDGLSEACNLEVDEREQRAQHAADEADDDGGNDGRHVRRHRARHLERNVPLVIEQPKVALANGHLRAL